MELGKARTQVEGGGGGPKKSGRQSGVNGNRSDNDGGNGEGVRLEKSPTKEVEQPRTATNAMA